MPTFTASEVTVNGRVITVTHPTKAYFAAGGRTKLDIVNYFMSVGPAMVRRLTGRPVAVQCFPEGTEGRRFFHRHLPHKAPDWVSHVTLPNGGTERWLLLTDVAVLIWVVNRGGLSLFPSSARNKMLDGRKLVAHEMPLVLTRQKGATSDALTHVAEHARALLSDHRLNATLTMAGPDVLQVHCALTAAWTLGETQDASAAVARELARRLPKHVCASSWPDKPAQPIRVGPPTSPLIAPYSIVVGAEAADAVVAIPTDWAELRERPHSAAGRHRCTLEAATAIAAQDTAARHAEADAQFGSLNSVLRLHDRDVERGLASPRIEP